MCLIQVGPARVDQASALIAPSASVSTWLRRDPRLTVGVCLHPKALAIETVHLDHPRRCAAEPHTWLARSSEAATSARVVPLCRAQTARRIPTPLSSTEPVVAFPIAGAAGSDHPRDRTGRRNTERCDRTRAAGRTAAGQSGTSARGPFRGSVPGAALEGRPIRSSRSARTPSGRVTAMLTLAGESGT